MSILSFNYHKSQTNKYFSLLLYRYHKTFFQKVEQPPNQRRKGSIP